MNNMQKIEISSPVRVEWWRGAVIYQIYPRSFVDSNGSATPAKPLANG